MTRNGSIAIPAAILAVGMLLAGCSNAGAASPVATDTVDLPPSYRFAPAAIQVAAGTTVTWTNHDNFTHSVQLDGDAEPLAVLKPGESATHTFTDPGAYPYICSFHPQDMTGTVEVTGQ